MQIRSAGVGKWSRYLLFKCRDTLHISGTVEARNFKFCKRLTTKVTNEKVQNYIKGAVKGSRLRIFGPLHISGTVGARNFKFGTHFDQKGY